MKDWPFNNCGFAYIRFANEYKIVLCSSKQDLYAMSNLLIMAYDKVQFSLFYYLC